MLIVGAGLAGLIAANVFPQARVIEAAGRDKLEHKALLRFRSTVVEGATGIEFQKVRVFKGIWSNGGFVSPNIKLANLYSHKVIGKLEDRSIWNLDAVDRYIAPEDFISQLMDNIGSRLTFGEHFAVKKYASNCEPIISTMPMPILARMFEEAELPEFKSAPILVARYRVQHANVFQTIYFPDSTTNVYRASITGSLLIVESVGRIESIDVSMLLDAFGLHLLQIDTIDETKQQFGKIAPIDDAWRKNFILRASTQHNIYSVGRFATWKNILLDDVVQDLSVVKRLIKMGLYQQTKEASK